MVVWTVYRLGDLQGLQTHIAPGFGDSNAEADPTPNSADKKVCDPHPRIRHFLVSAWQQTQCFPLAGSANSGAGNGVNAAERHGWARSQGEFLLTAIQKEITVPG
jgi:hypothetical protein